MNVNKTIAIAIVTVLALLVVGGGIAFAQSHQPGWGMGGDGYQNGTPMPGYGMMLAPARSAGVGTGSGMMSGVDMNTMHQWMFTSGARSVHDIVWSGLAEALGLTPDELNSQLASGKTLTQMAEAQGVSQAQLAAALETSVKAGLDKAVAEGALTQAQADQMLSHMGGRFEWMIDHMGTGGMGAGLGNCHGVSAPQSNS